MGKVPDKTFSVECRERNCYRGDGGEAETNIKTQRERDGNRKMFFGWKREPRFISGRHMAQALRPSVKQIFHIGGKWKRYALSGKNGKACERTRVIPYVRIQHAICRAAVNGCVCGKLNRSM